jgi:hypothetical protein
MPATSTLDIDTRNDNDMAVVFPPTVEVISPQRFLEDLDLAVHEWLQQHEQQHHNDSSIDSDVKKMDDDRIIFTTMSTSTLMEVQKRSLNVSTTTTTSILPSPVSTMSDLFQLRGRILKLESSLRDKLSLHKRSTTLGELRKCKVEWRQMLSLLNDGHDDIYTEKQSSVLSSLAWSLSSTIASLELYDNYDNNDLDMSQKLLAPLQSATTTSSSSWERLLPKDQEKLLLHWSKERHSGRRGRNVARKEKTEDRIVLAERLQRQLDLIFNQEDTAFIDARLDDDVPLVDVYSKFVNTNYEV